METTQTNQSLAATGIRINVTLPITRFGAGPFSFDPLEHLIGAPIGSLLEPLRVGAIQRVPSATGTAVEVHPLALPEGEGLSIPLGQFGEIGFRNAGGVLVLAVPRALGAWVQEKLGAAVIAGPRDSMSMDGASIVTELGVRLTPGMKMAIPIGMLGEVGIGAG